jgi:hypothetical protein
MMPTPNPAGNYPETRENLKNKIKKHNQIAINSSYAS